MNEGDVGIYANLPDADMSAQDVSGVLKIIYLQGTYPFDPFCNISTS